MLSCLSITVVFVVARCIVCETLAFMLSVFALSRLQWQNLKYDSVYKYSIFNCYELTKRRMVDNLGRFIMYIIFIIVSTMIIFDRYCSETEVYLKTSRATP